MKKCWVLGALCVAWAAGCSSEAPTPSASSEPTRSTASAIQGGMNDTTHTFAVGVLVNINPAQGEVAFCSGALLAPNLVATARHCAANISSTQIDCATATFGTDFPTGEILVTTDATITGSSNFLHVAKVVTPQPTQVCGDDLALLILTSSVQLPEYVTPVLTPPMSDPSYSKSVTAIGYGIDTPTDMNGTSAGVRRIRQNIGLQCVPNDSAFPSCLTGYQGQMTAGEFYSGDGTCEGDSGSSAYDQANFSNGKWVSFGVLSRGGISPDGQTCQGGIYTRFDAWASLIQQTAQEAASMGGYTAPGWATGDDGGASSGDDGGTSSSTDGGSTKTGATCSQDSDCPSGEKCVSSDSGKTFVCASPCGSNSSCPAQYSCRGNSASDQYCFANDEFATSKSAGCAVAGTLDEPQPVPWRGMVAGLVLGAAAFAARRRRA